MPPPKPILAQEAFQDMAFPLHGVDRGHAFDSQRPQTTYEGVNVRTFEALTQRGRGGSRPGISKFIPGQLPSGHHYVQNLNVVIDPEAAALLGDYDYEGDDFVIDESNLGRGRGSHVRRGGSGNTSYKSRRKTPRIVWPHPADITLGTALSGTQLNAVAKDPSTGTVVAGSYVYAPASGAVLSAGAHNLRVDFTPTDVAVYKTTFGLNSITVTDTNIHFVQAKLSSAINQTDVAFTSNVTTGNLILVYAMAFNATTLAPTDSQGNTYTQIASETSGLYTLYLYAAYASATGALTVHPSFTGTNNYVCLLEYSGVKATGAVDNTSVNAETSPGDSWTAGVVTVTLSGELLIGGFFDDAIHSGSDTYFTAGTGFTKRAGIAGFPTAPGSGSLTLGSFHVEDYINPTTGSPDVPATIASGQEPGRYLAVAASFKKA